MDGIASIQVRNLNAWVDVARNEIMDKYHPGENDPYISLLNAAHTEENTYFRNVVHGDIDSIIRDIRKNAVYNAVLNQNEASVLDIGFGTETLTKKLYEQGCQIVGVDFSHEMIRIAREKMSNATLIQANFSKRLPAEISSAGFDFILATYSLHHLPDVEKVPFIESLLKRLHANGQILIGDVAFENRTLLNSCKEACGEE